MMGNQLKLPGVPPDPQSFLKELRYDTQAIPSVRFLDCESQTPELWANGGGITRMLAYGNDSSGSSAWRVSLATLSRAAEFSRFPGFDRTFLLIGDEDVDLCSEEGILPAFPGHPVDFSGDLGVRIALPTKPLKALNVMIRRGVYRSHVSVATNSLRITPASIQLLISLYGQWSVSSDLLKDVLLKPLHGIWVESRPEDLSVHHAGTGGELVSIAIEPIVTGIQQ